jgi:hypothetical protein
MTPQVEAILCPTWATPTRGAACQGGRIPLDAKWYIGNELVTYGRKPADYDPQHSKASMHATCR